MDDKDKSALDHFVDIYREVLATTRTDRVTEPSNEQMLVRDEGPTVSETTPAPNQTARANKGAAKRSARLPALEKEAAKRAPTKKAKKAPKKTAKKAAKKSAAKAITKKSRRGVKKKARRV